MSFTSQDFVSKWKRVAAREKQTYQEHFVDLCNLMGHQMPNGYDSRGTCFAFEMDGAGVTFWNLHFPSIFYTMI
jgi:hypothetical protein